MAISDHLFPVLRHSGDRRPAYASARDHELGPIIKSRLKKQKYRSNRGRLPDGVPYGVLGWNLYEARF